MTTIVWDGKTLAADQCSWSGGVRRRVRKVFKITAPDGRKFLVGFCGEGSFAIATMNWMSGIGEKPRHADFGVDPKNQFGIVIDDKGQVWGLSANMTYARYYESKFSVGAGQDIAWGALEAGATAKKAIQIALKRTDFAGLGVDCISF